MTRPHPVLSPAPPPADRRELLELIRQLAVRRETAAALELRAERSPNRTLALVLRGRAAEHREVAERLRADLAVHGVVPFHRDR